MWWCKWLHIISRNMTDDQRRLLMMDFLTGMSSIQSINTRNTEPNAVVYVAVFFRCYRVGSIPSPDLTSTWIHHLPLQSDRYKQWEVEWHSWSRSDRVSFRNRDRQAECLWQSIGLAITPLFVSPLLVLTYNILARADANILTPWVSVGTPGEYQWQ
jgi:hypothetical protein